MSGSAAVSRATGVGHACRADGRPTCRRRRCTIRWSTGRGSRASMTGAGSVRGHCRSQARRGRQVRQPAVLRAGPSGRADSGPRRPGRSWPEPGGESQDQGPFGVGVVEAERRRSADQRASKSAASAVSSSTSKPGGSPASTHVLDEDALGEGVQRADGGIVDLERGPPPCAGVAVGRPPRRWPGRTRWRSSAAAASVKVMAAISPSEAVPVPTSATMRPTSAVVLPVPAPATTMRLPSRSWAMLLRRRVAVGAMTRPLMTPCS